MSDSKACPVCRAGNHDSTGDHLFLMLDGNRYCCNKKEYHPDGKPYYEDLEGEACGGSDESKDDNLSLDEFLGIVNKSKSAPVAASNLPPAPTRGTVEKVRAEYRGITVETFNHFEVTAEYSGGNLRTLRNPLYETDTNRVLPDKVRVLPKDFRVDGKTGKGTRIQMFGQSVAKPAKKLLIVEGELDALSARQMFRSGKYTKNVEVVSLPLGANVKALLDNAKFLKNYKEYYIAMDQDEAGEKVSRDIASALPTAKFMSFSEKDANDMLTKGKESEFISSFFAAEIYKPESIVTVSDVIDKVLEKPTMGEPWPWPTLTAKTYGRNPGQGIYVGAGVKIGKSEFINEVVAFDISRGQKVAVLKYEEPPPMTIQRIAGKQDGIFYHKPGVVYNTADLKKTALAMEPFLLMYPAFGTAIWETTKDFIRYAALVGCTTIIIDPITKLSNSLDSSQTEDMLRTLSDELACMAQDLGFFYIVTCHLKAPANGQPHERGGRVQSNQFRGSRAMMENTYYMMGIERNKDPALPEDDQNTSTFVLLEDRNFGNSCQFPVFYNKTDQSYLEKVGGGTF